MQSSKTTAPFKLAALRIARFSAGCLVFGFGGAIAQAQGNDERPDVTIDMSAVSEAVSNLAKEVEANFPVADTASRIAGELRKGLGNGRYNQSSARMLASMLTADLRKLSGDPHFRVDYFVVPRKFPADTSTNDPVSDADRRLAFRLQNFGFARVERLAGNIGYLKLDRFEMPSLSTETAAAAMQFIAGTDALIIDLRENGGGYLAMATLLSSYFFAEPVHLSDRIGRARADLTQTWTYAVVPGQRYLDKPVYVLSGPRTFSAAEGFAYDLQSQKRAKIIGETTRGGANTAARLLLSSRFAVIVPNARVINVATAANWAGGLKPDVSTSASLALPTAHLAALEATAHKHKDDPLTSEIEKGIANLKSELAAVRPPQ